MKLLIIILLFINMPRSVFAQQTDPYVDSLFQINLRYLYYECSKVKHYNPLENHLTETYQFLTIFSEITNLNLIGNCYEIPFTDYEKIKKLDNWYKEYGVCINKQDYLELKKLLFNIETVHYKSIDDYFDSIENVLNNIQKKIKEYESRGRGI